MVITRDVQNQLLNLLLKLPISSSNTTASMRIDVLLFGLPESLVRSIPRYDDALPHLSSMITQITRWSEVEERSEVVVTLIDNAIRATDSQKVSSELAVLRNRIVRTIEGTPKSDVMLPITGRELQVVLAPELLSHSMLIHAIRASKSVARLKIPGFENGKPTGEFAVGTGWLIAPDLLLTNHHVVAVQPDQAIQFDDLVMQTRNGTAWFDFVSYNNAFYEYSCGELLTFDVTLDYALVRLSSTCNNHPPTSIFEWGYLPIYRERPHLTPQSRLNIIQHPGGAVKKYGMRSNHYVESEGKGSAYLQYTTHTEAGSSGSPVCDDEWRVVAIHHQWAQVEEHNYRGELIHYHNQGVYLDKILADIAHKSPSVYDTINCAQDKYNLH